MKSWKIKQCQNSRFFFGKISYVTLDCQVYVNGYSERQASHDDEDGTVVDILQSPLFQILKNVMKMKLLINSTSYSFFHWFCVINLLICNVHLCLICVLNFTKVSTFHLYFKSSKVNKCLKHHSKTLESIYLCYIVCLCQTWYFYESGY